MVVAKVIYGDRPYSNYKSIPAYLKDGNLVLGYNGESVI